MRRLLPLAAAALCGCIAYPRVYMTNKSGRARLDDGKPLRIQGAVVKECDSVQGGESQRVGRIRETTTDKDGNYSLNVYGVAWNYRNFVTDTECSSHVQLFVCRDVCKEADDVDINILGK